MSIDIETLLHWAEDYETSREPLPIIFDTSDPASGKSYSVGELLKLFKSNYLYAYSTRIVILTQSPRSFDHKNFKAFLIVEGRRDAIINPKAQEIIDEANCVYARQANLLVAKGYNPNLICKKFCTPGINCKFKNVRFKSTLVQGVICSPASYEVQEGDVVFIDEGTNNIPLTTTVKISKYDFICILKFLKSLEINTMSKQKSKKVKELIVVLEMIIEILNKVEIGCISEDIAASEILIKECVKFFHRSSLSNNFINEIKKEFTDKLTSEDLIEKDNLPKNFLGLLFEYLKDQKHGMSFTMSSNHSAEINLEIINPIWLNIIEAYKKMDISMLVILDATPDKLFHRFIESKGLEIITKDFSIQKAKTKITQIINYMGSRTYFKLNNQVKGLLKKLAKEREGKIGLIWFSSKIHEVEEFLKLEGIIDKFVLGYWGRDNRGTNKFIECNTMIIAGRHIFPPNHSKMIAKALNEYLSCIKDETGGAIIPYPKTNMAIFRQHYDEIIRDFFLREVYQAIGRINRRGIKEEPLYRQSPEVYLLTNEPLDIEVDNLVKYEDVLDYEEVASDKEIKRRKSLKLSKDESFSRCEEAYAQLIKQGQKPTRDKIRRLAEISNRVATEFLREKKRNG